MACTVEAAALQLGFGLCPESLFDFEQVVYPSAVSREDAKQRQSAWSVAGGGAADGPRDPEAGSPPRGRPERASLWGLRPMSCVGHRPGAGSRQAEAASTRQPPSAGNFPNGRGRTAKSNETEECG